MKHIQAFLAVFACLLVFSSVVYGAFHMAKLGAMSKPKSDKELCEERGGVHYQPYRSNALCLDKKSLR